MATKHCKRCDLFKGYSEFHRSSKSKDGCSAWCRSCMSEYMRTRHQANPSRNRTAALDYYHATAEANAEQLRTRARSSYAKHRKSRLVTATRYRKSPAGRASKAKSHTKRRYQSELAGPLDTNYVAHLFATSTHCVFCFELLVPTSNNPRQPTLEHLTPLSREGSNANSNLAISCRTCNARKHTLTAEEFRERLRQGAVAALDFT